MLWGALPGEALFVRLKKRNEYIYGIGHHIIKPLDLTNVFDGIVVVIWLAILGEWKLISDGVAA